MPTRTREWAVAVEKRGLDDQGVGGADLLGQGSRFFDVADNCELGAGSLGSLNHLRRDQPAVGERHLAASRQLPPCRSIRYSQCSEAIGKQWAARFLLESVPQAPRPTMRH